MTATTNAQAKLVDELEAALGTAPWTFDDGSRHHIGRAVSAHRTIQGLRIKIVGCVERPGWHWYAASGLKVIGADCSDTAAAAVAALQTLVPVSITA